jgi:hypothetical protein
LLRTNQVHHPAVPDEANRRSDHIQLRLELEPLVAFLGELVRAESPSSDPASHSDAARVPHAVAVEAGERRHELRRRLPAQHSRLPCRDPLKVLFCPVNGPPVRVAQR